MMIGWKYHVTLLVHFDKEKHKERKSGEGLCWTGKASENKNGAVEGPTIHKVEICTDNTNISSKN